MFKKSLYRYVPRHGAIGKYRCVCVDSNDRLLIGLKGWIFLANSSGTRLGMVTVDKWKNEKIKYYDINKLESLIVYIKYFNDVSKQALYANNPNLRAQDSGTIKDQ